MVLLLLELGGGEAWHSDRNRAGERLCEELGVKRQAEEHILSFNSSCGIFHHLKFFAIFYASLFFSRSMMEIQRKIVKTCGLRCKDEHFSFLR